MNEDLKKYIGQRFGRLTIIDVDTTRRWYVICRCECKTVKSIKIYSLLNGLTCSCGCLQKETVKKVVAPKGNNKTSYIKQQLTSLKKPPGKRNKTGVKGVCFVKGRYRAYINVNGKRFFLGDYADLSEAKSVRQQAEKHALKELNKFLANKKSVD